MRRSLPVLTTRSTGRLSEVQKAEHRRKWTELISQLSVLGALLETAVSEIGRDEVLSVLIDMIQSDS